MMRSIMRAMTRASAHLPKSQRTRMTGFSILLIAALAVGCAHSSKRAAQLSATAVPRVPEVPAFLNGPLALLFTNVHGFRARVALESGSSARQEAVGELMGQGGSLVFMPALSGSATKRDPVTGCAFIWNVPTHSGYILNGPMQAYAPISAGPKPASRTTDAATSHAAPESIDGHLCECANAVVVSSDGTTATFRLWQAADLNGLPLRVTSTSTGTPMTLTLSTARLETLPNDLFAPPHGFTKYDSAETLVRALTARQHNLTRRKTYPPDDDQPVGGPGLPPPARL